MRVRVRVFAAREQQQRPHGTSGSCVLCKLVQAGNSRDGYSQERQIGIGARLHIHTKHRTSERDLGRNFYCAWLSCCDHAVGALLSSALCVGDGRQLSLSGQGS